MLVLAPESACDVCAEPYTQESLPNSIPCGHTFCASCLSKIAQGLWSPRAAPACPLCREGFAASDIRKIRFDAAPSGSPGYPHVHPYPNYFPASSASTPKTGASFGTTPLDEDALDEVNSDDGRVEAEAKRLEDKISRAAGRKCTFEELSALQREVEQWLAKERKRRPDKEHASLRLSASLLGAILVNGFAYNEAKRSQKGVEGDLRDKLDAAEQVKHRLEIELHRQRTQYSQKLMEVQQLKQEMSASNSASSSRYASPGPGSSTPATARPLGSSLSHATPPRQPTSAAHMLSSATVTPPRALTSTPTPASMNSGIRTTPSSRVTSPLVSRSGTPVASRASTPGVSSTTTASTYYPRRAATFTSAAAETSHLPLGAVSETAHLPLAYYTSHSASNSGASTPNSAHSSGPPNPFSAPVSTSTSPERSSGAFGVAYNAATHQRWLPSEAAATSDREGRSKTRPASALGVPALGGHRRSASAAGWRA